MTGSSGKIRAFSRLSVTKVMDELVVPARIPKVQSTYYFRRAVPPRLRPYFLTANGNPRTEFMISLEEKNLSKAKDKWLAQAVQVAALLKEAEAKLAKGIPPTAALATVTRPSRPKEGPWASEEEFEHWQEGERLWAVEDAAREAGLAADPIQRAREEGAQAALARRDREDQEAREALASEREASRVPLMSLFDAYLAERQPAPATVKRWRPVMDDLIDFLGHDDARRISKANVVAWKEALLTATKPDGSPLRIARTVKETYLASVKVVLEFGRENGSLKVNAATDVKVRVPKKIRLRNPGFTNEEALTILQATMGPQPDSLTDSHRVARRWVPWLCAYTGARVGEMSQLRAEDVKQVDGVWTLRITPDAGGVKSGKFRVVPLHSHLIEQGFVDFAAKGEGPLFYNPSRGRGGSDANKQHKKVGERLGAWVRKLGVNDPNVQPNHAWRHRFETEMRRAKLDYEARHVLVGHAHQTESGTYGEWDAPSLKREIDKLPRLTPAKSD
jgi:integrase